MSNRILTGTAALCLVCHSPVRTAGALHCGSLCRLVWKRLMRERSAEASVPLPDDILRILDRLETRQPLVLSDWHRLSAWVSEPPR